MVSEPPAERGSRRGVRAAPRPTATSGSSSADLIWLTIACAMPPVPNFVPFVAATTPASSAATSRISATYSTVPCPRSPLHAHATRAWHQPISRYTTRSSLSLTAEGESSRAGCAGTRRHLRQDTRTSTLAQPMRALVVTNMHPTAARPALGRFVHDQVQALRRIDGVEVELFAFPPGLRSYPRAARELRRRYRGERFDVIHAHFGLTAWPALALRGAPHVVTLHGTDLAHPRSRRLSRAALRFVDLAATVSASLARERLPGMRGRIAVLPCGVDLERFRPLPRAEARRRLGLDPDAPCLLFPADPARAEKRFDRARAVAGDAPPADARGGPSRRGAAVGQRGERGARPVGAGGLRARRAGGARVRRPGARDAGRRRAARARGDRRRALRARSTRTPGAQRSRRTSPPPTRASTGRARAALFSAERMAERVLVAWRAVASESGGTGRARGYTRRRGAVRAGNSASPHR